MSSIPEGLAAALSRSYRLERELGAGGMATVYLAEDLKHHRQVAVKVLRPELVASIGADRFLREIEVTAHLQHPHILALYDSGQADGFLYYVMPYVPGDSLRARLQQEGQLPVADALRITRGVAAALGHAHQHGVVHRDIKPENILLAGGEPVVADFGIARALVEASGSALTSTGLTIGTPTYMSPEQASAAKLDGRSDLYSLGCVLYEMLAGEPPYLGATAQAITARKLQEPMPSLRVVRSSVPAGVEEVVRRTLAIAPADRYATAEELIGALDRAVSGPQGATSLTAARSTRTTQTLWIWRGIAAAFAIIAGTFLGLWRGARTPTNQGKPDAVVRFSLPLPASLPGEPADPERGFGEVAFSPNGRLIAATVIGTGAAKPVYLRDLATEEFRSVPGTEGGAYVFFSPDGRWLGFYLPTERRLMRVRVAGGPPQEICQCEVSGLSRPSWLARDTIVVGSMRLYDLGTVPASGGEIRPLGMVNDSTVGQDLRSGGIPSPDGRYLLFDRWNHSQNSSIWLLDRQTGAQRRLIDGGQEPVLVGTDLLVYSRPYFPSAGTLVVARFDPDRGAVVGEPVSVSGPESRHFGFAVSATGDLVYLDHPPELSKFLAALTEIDRSGRVSRTIDGNFGTIRLSPDGRRVAYSEPLSPSSPANAIWVRDLNTGSSTRLTDERGSAYWPVWSPDGRSIAYISNRRGDRRFQIYLIPADGTAEPRQLTQMTTAYVHPQSWTPDGRTLIIQAPVDSVRKMDLLTIDVNGDLTPVPLLATAASEIHGAVSPDGRWLAYASDQSGAWEVYLQPFQRPGGAVKISAGGGWTPLWRADGRELFYRSINGREMWASSIQDGVPGQPRRLFVGSYDAPNENGPNYGVLPDGGILLVRNQVPPGKPKATVVLGWKAVALQALAATKAQAR